MVPRIERRSQLSDLDTMMFDLKNYHLDNIMYDSYVFLSRKKLIHNYIYVSKNLVVFFCSVNVFSYLPHKD